jgi:hypothetical protein
MSPFDLLGILAILSSQLIDRHGGPEDGLAIPCDLDPKLYAQASSWTAFLANRCIGNNS